MKKGIITILILMLSTASVFAQLQGFGTYRIANATTPLGLNVAKGSVIFNIDTDDIFILKKNENSTATLSGMVLGTDYINLQLWEGKKFADYLDQPVLTSSSPTFNRLDLHGILSVSDNIFSQGLMPASNNLYDIGSSTNYFANTYTDNLYVYGTGNFSGNVNVGINLAVNGTITSANFISNVTVGTQPYSTNSTTLNTNLNADLLDGQHGSYYRSYNNLTDKEYIGLQHITAETDTLSKGVFLKYGHFALADTTIKAGLITYNSADSSITINATGDYVITYSFQLSNSETEPILTFQVANGATILSQREIAVTASNRDMVSITTSAHLTAGDVVALQYTCSLAIAEYLTISNMNVYIEKK